MLGRGNGRPSRPEVERVALDLLQRRGAEILATARRYSSTDEDAEDAYQRALEILITKAPTTAEDELVPWLKTVVKHEAFSMRRQRERAAPVTDDGELRDPASPTGGPHESSERYERLRQGAEALGRLKPQEVRALLLKAEGYSYREISAITGWTYTKVNRCLTEGRRAFVQRLAGIEAGSECERLLPLLSALADGEASAEDLQALRPHLRTCLACRARLREFRTAPKRVAALLPPVAVAAQGDPSGPIRSLFESLVGTFGERAHAAAELATGQKVAAVAATAAVAAGGGAGVKELAVAEHPAAPVQHAKPAPARAEAPTTAPGAPAPAPPPRPAPQPSQSAPGEQPAPKPPPPPPPDPAAEFAPAAAPAPAPSAPEPSAPSRGSGSGASGEFAP
jgi:RNA polymerase sigma factor (sigma-70 family)